LAHTGIFLADDVRHYGQRYFSRRLASDIDANRRMNAPQIQFR
jgi:hypothetical protein